MYFFRCFLWQCSLLGSIGGGIWDVAACMKLSPRETRSLCIHNVSLNSTSSSVTFSKEKQNSMKLIFLLQTLASIVTAAERPAFEKVKQNNLEFGPFAAYLVPLLSSFPLFL